MDDDPDAWAKVKMHTYTDVQIDMEWDGLFAFTVLLSSPEPQPLLQPLRPWLTPEHRWSGTDPTWRQWPRTPSRRRPSLAGSCTAVAAVRAQRGCDSSCASAPARRAMYHPKRRVCHLGLRGGWLALPTWPKLVRQVRWGSVHWGAPRWTQAASTWPLALWGCVLG